MVKNLKISPFGKYCRKLRIERDEKIRDMAAKLNVTPAYLSAVELGKRKIPSDWKNKIVELYGLQDNEIEEINIAIYESITSIKIDLKSASENKRRLAGLFAQKVEGLTDEQIKSIKEVLLS